MNFQLLSAQRQPTAGARYPISTGIRGNRTPLRRIWSASGGGSRSASAAARSTTRPTTASPTKSQRRIPRPADLDQAGQFARRAHQQLAGRCVQMDTVIADQHGRRNLSGAAGQDEIERQARFAGTRGPADQHGAIADQHGGGVDACAAARHGAGSRTTKRAPAIVGLPSALTGPARFSAQMRPPWASMICLEIDSPSPEFCPKP